MRNHSAPLSPLLLLGNYRLTSGPPVRLRLQRACAQRAFTSCRASMSRSILSFGSDMCKGARHASPRRAAALSGSA